MPPKKWGHLWGQRLLKEHIRPPKVQPYPACLPPPGPAATAGQQARHGSAREGRARPFLPWRRGPGMTGCGCRDASAERTPPGLGRRLRTRLRPTPRRVSSGV